MSADKERDAFHVNRIQGRDLTALLTAQSYRPAVVSAVRTIKSFPWQTLSNLCENRIGPGPHPRYTQNGHPCVKTQNVSGLIADADPAGWVHPAEATRYQKYLVQRGDVLLNLTGAGSIGRVALFLGDQRPLTNQHLARLAIKQAYDSGYVAAFLNTWWGQRSIEQGISGATGQLNLVNDHVRALPIPLPARDAQVYIGSKVREAEMLRERARGARLEVDRRFAAAGLLHNGQYAHHARTPPAFLGSRLDPLHYRADLVAAEDAVRHYPVLELGDRKHFLGLSDGDHGNPVYGEGPAYVRANEMTDSRWTATSSVRLSNAYAKSLARSCWAITGDVVFSIVGTLGLAAVVDEQAPVVLSRGVAKVRSLTLPPHYVKAFMRTPCFSALLLRRSVGTIQRGVYLSALSFLPIPELDGTLVDEISRLEQGSDECFAAAEQLTTAARLLVEALIERNVTEVELATAQHDPAADRALLARLTVHGIDASGARPLFEDVGRLLELLAVAQQRETA